MIAVVDYGLGNLGSATKALRRCGAEVELSGSPAVLRSARALVLPGDGAFGASMQEIRARGLEPELHAAVARGVPLLGICVGLQVLFEEGEEHGRHQGLGLLPGRVRALFADGAGGAAAAALSLPHMGWNRLLQRRPHALLEGVADGSHVYFVHSYRCEARAEHVLAACEYGLEFPALVAHDRIAGMQFHPEKSQDVGLRLLANFVRWVESLWAADAAAGRRAPALGGCA